VVLLFSGIIISIFPGICRASQDIWRQELLTLQGRVDRTEQEAHKLSKRFENGFPIQWDWLTRDAGQDITRWIKRGDRADFMKKALHSVLNDLGRAGSGFRDEFNKLCKANVALNDRAWFDLYVHACEKRREIFLRPLLNKCSSIVFTKHSNLGGSHYAYTEAQSDAQNERNFTPDASLCVLEMDGIYGRVRTLIEDANGVIRDPDVSYDGQRILFSWKKSDRKDDYHLYEMDTASGNIRQLTFGLGFADYEGAYLPNGDIVFNSTRCVQTVDCWWTEVSNLYTCDKDGGALRRLSFDAVHTNFPTVTPDGRVLYTRWEYNDRGQLYPQPLFQMNPDGTGQTEYYGNNSWFPTTILHARGIDASTKVVAIATGHHTSQFGKLIIIDAAKGRQENNGIQLIAPIRPTEAVRVDRYGQQGQLFQYPYPVGETMYLVASNSFGPVKQQLFRIYLVDIDGRRELLAWDNKISCNQPIPLAPRPLPHVRPGMVDYNRTTGTYYVHDVYAGDGLKGIPRGTIRKLRVIALEFRAAGIGSNRNNGPAGGALVSTPISINNGSWDVKHVLGDATVYEDGSACFEVPARTPVYFQALDAKGHAVQNMRSWSTLQPGESISCVGCHESKNSTPRANLSTTLAMKAGIERLKPFYGPARGFSFIKEIQPVLDRHCISCHSDREKVLDAGIESVESQPERQRAFSLLGTVNEDKGAKRLWADSYLALTQKGKPNRLVNWLNAQSVPPMLPPYFAGAAKSELITMLENGHKDVKLSQQEMEKIACWIDLLVPYCGDYTEANAWTDEEKDKYEHFSQKRRRMEDIEQKNIDLLIARGRRHAGSVPR
jgi:hypothetical protein